MAKRGIIFFMFVILLSGFVLADSIKIEFPTGDNFKAGEKINLKVSLFNSQNNPVDGKINLILEDSEKIRKIEKIVSSREITEIDLGESALHGFWAVTATYQDVKATEIFTVEIEELAKFEIHNDQLVITNIGNTRYTKTIQIVIGNTVGIKEPKLDVGDSVTYRLIAPEGNYNIRITDGITSIQRNNVVLTGNVVGILDERTIGGNTLTGGIKPEDDSGLNYLSNNKFIYIFILVIFGVTILLAIERTYRKRAEK